MTYKYDFKKFIDSPDLKNYLKEEMFTPGEQAVLITKSLCPIEEKIKALQYLANIYGENPYCPRKKCSQTKCRKKNYLLKELIDCTLGYWRSVLEARNDNSDVIFAAIVYEKGRDNTYLNDYKFFDDFKSSYKYIVDEKKRLLEYGVHDGDTIFFANIQRIPINRDDAMIDEREIYYFNQNMELYRVFEAGKHVLCKNLEELYVYIPLPFKKGDIVKCDLRENGVIIGKILEDINERERYHSNYCKENDYDAISMCVEESCEGKSYENFMIPTISLEYASEAECVELKRCVGSKRVRV